MTRKFYLLFIAIAAALSLSSAAYATPMYYTFTGLTADTDQFADDGAGAAEAAGLSLVGSAVSYTLLVDTAVDGYITRYDGSTEYRVDDADIDSFYTSLVSSPPILNQNGGFAPAQSGTSIETLHYGHTGYGRTFLYGGDSGDAAYNQVWTTYGAPYIPIADWVVGTDGFEGVTWAYDDQGNRTELFSVLTLTAISDTNPYGQVPEPSTLLLLGSGIAGFGFVRRRFKQ